MLLTLVITHSPDTSPLLNDLGSVKWEPQASGEMGSHGPPPPPSIPPSLGVLWLPHPGLPALPGSLLLDASLQNTFSCISIVFTDREAGDGELLFAGY